MPATETGTVKKFFPSKGYGIIAPDDGGPDVFFHTTVCHFPRHLPLGDDDPVRYQREERPRPDGWRASVVWLVNKPGACPCCGGKLEAA